MTAQELMRKYLDFLNEESLDEKWGETTTVSPEERGKYKGKPKLNFSRVTMHSKNQDRTIKGVLSMAECENWRLPFVQKAVGAKLSN